MNVSLSDYDELRSIVDENFFSACFAVLLLFAGVCFLMHEVVKTMRVSSIGGWLKEICYVLRMFFVMLVGMGTGLFSMGFYLIEMFFGIFTSVGKCMQATCRAFKYTLMFPFLVTFRLVVEFCHCVKMLLQFSMRFMKVFLYMPCAIVNWNLLVVGSLVWGIMLVFVKEVNYQTRMLSLFLTRAYVHLKNRFWQENKESLDSMAEKCHTILTVLKIALVIVTWWYTACHLHDFVEKNTGANMVHIVSGHYWKTDMSLRHMCSIFVTGTKFLFSEWEKHGVPLMYTLLEFLELQCKEIQQCKEYFQWLKPLE